MALPARKRDAEHRTDPDEATGTRPDEEGPRARFEAARARHALLARNFEAGLVRPGRSTEIPLPACSARLLSWRMAEPGVVELSVGLFNRRAERTCAGWLVIGAAPLGAFADSHPVERVRIEALGPGATSWHAVRIPTRELGLGDSERLRTNPLHDHWIGNINVYFEDDPDAVVERHCALGLRVPPSTRSQLWMFLKDDAYHDAYHDDYSAKVECSQPGWVAEVSFRDGSRTGTLSVETPCLPGSECRVVARIQRGRDRKVVPVEFTFETTHDRHDRLGCPS